MNKKTIGILGGMGPEATADLFYRIIRATPVERDQDHLHVIINSNAKIPDRTQAILGIGPSPLFLIIDTGRKLEAAGADFLIMPCNSAHYFYNELQKSFSIPLLNMIKISTDYIRNKYPYVKKVGLLATDGTIASLLYHDSYREYDIEVITPSISSQKTVMKAIYKHIKTGDLHKGAKLLHGIANELVETGADIIICGCTEISLVLHDGDLSVPIADPLQILAEEAIRLAS